MPTRMTIATTLVALLLAGAPHLHAQEPEPPPTPAPAPAPEPPPDAEEQEPEPDRWGAQVGFSLNGSGGNENLTVLLTEVELTHLETTSYELSAGGRYRYGRSEGEEVANSVRGALSADLWPSAGWSPFVFGTVERDPFRKLRIRVNSGGGVKRTFYREDWDEVSLSGAVLYDYERTEVDGDPGPSTRATETARWSWRFRARHQLREGTRFEQVTFFLPAWDEFDDYLIESRSTARLGLTRTLALTAAAVYERDSTPASEVKPDDWSVAVGLSLSTTW